MSILIAVLVLILIIAAVFILRGRKSVPVSLPQPEKRDILTLKDVISFFKQPDVTALLKQSKDRIAVAIREKQESGDDLITLCIYSKQTSDIVQPLKRFSTPVLDPDLLDLFGEKDMLILQ